MGPTRPNRTRHATAADAVMTPRHIARLAIDHFKPTGLLLDPARGGGAFYDELPAPRDWCEIAQGRDFFAWKEPVDWIITNPPYSIYDAFLTHAFALADNVVFLVPLVKTFKSMHQHRLVADYGGLREILLVGSGGACGFHVGFPVGYLHYRRGCDGPIGLTEATLARVGEGPR